MLYSSWWSTPSSSAIRLFFLADVFWYLVAGLCEINHVSVSVPAVDEIVENCFLVAFTNQVIKDDNLLVVHRKLFKVDYFTPRRLDDFRASLRVEILVAKSRKRV